MEVSLANKQDDAITTPSGHPSLYVAVSVAPMPYEQQIYDPAFGIDFVDDAVVPHTKAIKGFLSMELFDPFGKGSAAKPLTRGTMRITTVRGSLANPLRNVRVWTRL